MPEQPDRGDGSSVRPEDVLNRVKSEVNDEVIRTVDSEAFTEIVTATVTVLAEAKSSSETAVDLDAIESDFEELYEYPAEYEYEPETECKDEGEESRGGTRVSDRD